MSTIRPNPQSRNTKTNLSQYTNDFFDKHINFPYNLFLGLYMSFGHGINKFVTYDTKIILKTEVTSIVGHHNVMKGIIEVNEGL